MVLEDETHGCCGTRLRRQPSITNYKDADLTEAAIIDNAKLGMQKNGWFADKKGQRTARIVHALGWPLEATGAFVAQKVGPVVSNDVIVEIDEQLSISGDKEEDADVRHSISPH